MAQRVLSYWFRDEKAETSFKRWFEGGRDHDREIERLFRSTLEGGEWLSWDPTGPAEFLAKVILLDQVPRHIYRGTAAAYAYDDLAVTHVRKHVRRHLHRFTAAQAMFALMPFQHNETERAQLEGESLLCELLAHEPRESERKVLRKALSHQWGHMDVLRRFGRFPKRNPFLARVSTRAEIEHSATPGPY